MTKIYLVRHAQAEGNLYRRIHGMYDSCVTPQGYAQIAALRRRFADIPVDAVYYSGGNAYVYLYEDGKAKKASIEVGINDDDYVEVTDGLSADDLVVSTWSNNLYEGADIQLAGSSESADSQAGAPDGLSAPAAAGQNDGVAPAGENAPAGEPNADAPSDRAVGETPAADNSAAGSSAAQEG